MAKQQKIMASGATSAGAAAARSVEPIAEPQPSDAVAETSAPSSVPGPEQVARLAYSYWQARGCPEGSAEEDWLRAELELGKQAAGTGG